MEAEILKTVMCAADQLIHSLIQEAIIEGLSYAKYRINLMKKT